MAIERQPSLKLFTRKIERHVAEFVGTKPCIKDIVWARNQLRKKFEPREK